jgi:hypothetical protein
MLRQRPRRPRSLPLLLHPLLPRRRNLARRLNRLVNPMSNLRPHPLLNPRRKRLQPRSLHPDSLHPSYPLPGANSTAV